LLLVPARGQTRRGEKQFFPQRAGGGVAGPGDTFSCAEIVAFCEILLPTPTNKMREKKKKKERKGTNKKRDKKKTTHFTGGLDGSYWGGAKQTLEAGRGGKKKKKKKKNNKKKRPGASGTSRQ